MDRRQMVRRYRETPRPAGIYRVSHAPSGRILLGASADAPAMLNRIRAQLRMGANRNRRLQEDWDADGPEAFTFEVLDTLPPGDAPGYDPRSDLEALEALWREKLAIPGDLEY